MPTGRKPKTTARPEVNLLVRRGRTEYVVQRIDRHRDSEDIAYIVLYSPWSRRSTSLVLYEWYMTCAVVGKVEPPPCAASVQPPADLDGASRAE